MEIVNQNLYYALKNRIHQFNRNYGDLIKQHYGEEHLLSEDMFEGLRDTWTLIAIDETGDDAATNLGRDHHISEKNFNLLLEATQNLYSEFRALARGANLGETHVASNGLEETDYTYIAGEILEIGMLALHTYTNIFEQCKYELSQGDATVARDRAEILANALYFDKDRLKTIEVDHASQQILSNPLGGSFNGIEKLFNQDNYQVLFFQSGERVPYYQKKAASDARQKANEANEQELAKEKKAEQDAIIAEAKRLKDEQDAAERVERENAEKEALRRDYEKEKNAFPHIPDVANPNLVNAPFYTYFSKYAERMGIDNNLLNAQSIIEAANQVYIKNDIREKTTQFVDNAAFAKDMLPIYRQIEHITYEAYIEKCIENNIPINMSVPANEVLDLMGALLYTMYPTAFNASDKGVDVLQRATQLLNGGFSVNESLRDENVRKDALAIMKENYLKKDISFYNSDAEARFASFAEERKSSNNIVRESASIVDAYNEYKTERENNVEGRTALQEANLKKAAMDAAYALEKRIETRYQSRLSRFFRYFSYAKQRDELARVKSVLGIPADVRVADRLVESRVNDLFVDVSNVKTDRAARLEAVKGNPLTYITKTLEKQVDHLPAISHGDFVDEQLRRIEKYQQLSEEEKNRLTGQRPDESFDRDSVYDNIIEQDDESFISENDEEEKEMLAQQKLEEEKRQKELEEKAQKEREEREREERNERIRKEREEFERREREEQERQRREEELKAEQERLRSARENLYEGHLKEIQQVVKETAEKVEAMRLAEENRQNQKREKLEAINNSIKALDDEILADNVNNGVEMPKLTQMYADITMQIENKRAEICQTKEMQKLLKKAHKEAKKNVGKTASQSNNTYSNQIEEIIATNPDIQAYKSMQGNIQKEIEQRQTALSAKTALLKDFWAEKRTLMNEKEPINTEYESAKEYLKYMENALKDYQDRKDELITTGKQTITSQKIFRDAPKNMFAEGADAEKQGKLATDDPVKTNQDLLFY